MGAVVDRAAAGAMFGDIVPEEARVDDVAADYDDFFRVHYPRVVRLVHGLLGDRARAEEVGQEAFVRLYQHWGRVSGYERPDAWVRRVAVRLAMRVARRDRLRSALERRALPHPTDVPTEHSALDAVSRLPHHQRVAVALYYLDDLPVADVAVAMGCSEPTVRVHLHRGRRRLAELMGQKADADA